MFKWVMKLALGGLSSWKFWGIGVAAAGALVFVLNYVGAHSRMKAEIGALEARVASCIDTRKQMTVSLAQRNERLQRVAEERRQSAAADRERFAQAQMTIDALREEVNDTRQALEVTRFETLEAIRDDEDFADWVDGDTPTRAWSLLGTAVDGGSRSD